VPGTFKLINWLHHSIPFLSSSTSWIHQLCQASFCILSSKDSSGYYDQLIVQVARLQEMSS